MINLLRSVYIPVLPVIEMSIQTKDLIRYNNHTTYYNKNHSKFIQKSQQHSTANHLTSHYQPTAKRLGPLPSGNRKLSLSSQLSSAPPRPLPSDNRKLSLSSKLSSAALIAHPSPGRSHSTQHLPPNSRAATLPCRLEKPAREACAACRRTLQEGS